MELLPTLRLAAALDAAAQSVEDFCDRVDASGSDWTTWRDAPGFYNWGDPVACNCGLVAKALGVQKDTVRALVPSEWTIASSFYAGNSISIRICPLTGISLSDLFAGLAAEGLDHLAIRDLEYLMDDDVRARAGLDPDMRYNMFGEGVTYSDAVDPDAFVRYARAWATMIRETHHEMVTAPRAAVAA